MESPFINKPVQYNTNQSCKRCMTTKTAPEGPLAGKRHFLLFTFRYFRLHKITHDNAYFLRQLANSPRRVFLFVSHESVISWEHPSRRWKLLKQNNAVSQVKVDVDADSDRSRRETSIVSLWHDVMTVMRLTNIPLLLSFYFLHSWRVHNLILLCWAKLRTKD